MDERVTKLSFTQFSKNEKSVRDLMAATQTESKLHGSNSNLLQGWVTKNQGTVVSSSSVSIFYRGA